MYLLSKNVLKSSGIQRPYEFHMHYGFSYFFIMCPSFSILSFSGLCIFLKILTAVLVHFFLYFPYGITLYLPSILSRMVRGVSPSSYNLFITYIFLFLFFFPFLTQPVYFLVDLLLRFFIDFFYLIFFCCFLFLCFKNELLEIVWFSFFIWSLLMAEINFCIWFDGISRFMRNFCAPKKLIFKEKIKSI